MYPYFSIMYSLSKTLKLQHNLYVWCLRDCAACRDFHRNCFQSAPIVARYKKKIRCLHSAARSSKCRPTTELTWNADRRASISTVPWQRQASAVRWNQQRLYVCLPVITALQLHYRIHVEIWLHNMRMERRFLHKFSMADSIVTLFIYLFIFLLYQISSLIVHESHPKEI